MRIRVNVFVAGFVCVCLGALGALAQQKSDTSAQSNTQSSGPSLGDLARQLKAQKAKEPKPALVITNDNIPTPKEGEPGFASTAKTSAASTGKAGEATGAHDAEYYRSHLSKLQDQLSLHKRELDVLQQKLGQNQMQYYNDPNKSLLQQYSRDDINKFTADIDAKKAQIADDEKAIDDLHDQLRHEGGDPGWLR